MNRQCAAFGHDVNEEACSLCPLRVYKVTRKCKQPAQVARETAVAATEISDEEFVTLVKELPSGESDLAEMQAPDGKQVPDYPALPLQIWLYKEALMRWNSAGRPVRTDDEVKEILEKHCIKCDWYDPDKKRCRGCGCKVSSSSFAVINKIKMATEHCPKEKW
jgi:hypothetical protein